MPYRTRCPSLGLIAVLLLTVGCVSKGKYEVAVAERDSLAMESAALRAANDSLNVLFREEIAANELELRQLADGVHLEIPADVMYASGAAGAEVGPQGREDAVKRNRDVMGATNPANAAEGTIRKRFAESIERNCVHGSDAPETAAIEVPFFFSSSELL